MHMHSNHDAERTGLPARGVVYVATGEKYVSEAADSASSVKGAMPDVQIALVTDSATGPAVFDQIVEFHLDEALPSAYLGYLYKILGLWQAPFEECVFLDSDIHCCAPFGELFTLLDAYDLGAAMACMAGDASQRPSRAGLPDGQPAMYRPQLNSGVLVYSRNARIERFIQDWASVMVEQAPRDGRYYSDQTLWEGVLAASDVRHVTIPSEYNCRIGVPQQLHGTVKLLHGRPKAGWAAQARLANGSHGYRIMFPNIAAVTLEQGYFRIDSPGSDTPETVGFGDFARNLKRPAQSPVAANPDYAIMANELT